MENSKISWTDHTFNPWIGCTKVSAGCVNCYAETLMDTRFGKVKWGPQGTRARTSASEWRKPFTWDKKAGRLALRYRVFCGSLCDFFEDRLVDLVDWRDEAFDLMVATPNLDWLLLTKRPHLVMDSVPAAWRKAKGWPENVHVGTSVEDQQSADRRLPWLMKVPAPVKFVSAEPLLGPIDMNSWYVDWLIVGGESGNNSEYISPMHPDWARGLRDWAKANHVPFFMKQMGAWFDSDIPGSDPRSETVDGRWFRWRGGHGAGIEDFPADLAIQETPQRLMLPF